MVKRISTFILLCFGLAFFSSSWAAGFSAHVDRNEVSEQDTFTLVLRYEAQAILKEPDTKPLEKDFRILNQHRSQQFSSVNGKTESYTNWVLTLTPLRTGTLTIPAIKFDGQSSQPIEITVKPLTEEAKKQAEQDFFFETSVTPDSNLVVQGQLLYTEKLYYRYQHDNATLSEVKVTDARVQQLGDIRQYTTVINGIQFGVYERQFAIFPEMSGELVIPGTRFNASIVDRYSWGRGRPVKATSKPIRLQVASIPDSYPSNATWLPTSKLTLEEQFSTPPNQWQEGEAVTRTFTLKAQGIQGSQLPEIKLPMVDGVRYYPDQAKTNDSLNNLGVLGVSEQAVAMVVTQAGELVLPEVRIPWWNINSNKLEYATLPARTIKVKGQTKPIQQAPITVNTPDIDTSKKTETAAAPVVSSTSNFAINYGLLGLLALSLLLNIWLLTRSRKNTVIQSDNQPKMPSESSQWRALKQACQQQDPQQVRQALLAWVNNGGLAHLNLSLPLVSLSALAQVVRTPALALALNELDATLFSAQGNSAFNATQLLQLLEQEKKIQPNKEKSGVNLYP